jgi:hypothetical protein
MADQGAEACLATPPAWSIPVGAIDVRSFGARGDGVTDDTPALRRALASMRPGDWLVFPAGVYRHSARLVIETPSVTLAGRDAVLHATNPADQALLIQASGIRILGFTMTAVTDRRRGAPWESRIAIWRHGEDLPAVDTIEIRGNRIVESGPPGSAGANSSSSAAIFVHNARDFVIAGNTVRRSLSDAIHITGGAQRGRVLGNTVRETGDDMIAVVSYLGDGDFTAETADRVAARYERRRRRELVRDVLIAGNDVAGQYWGRGITVVGGEDISIVGNRIDATHHGAAVYIAREQGYVTFGVRNVRVAGNRISRVQSDLPAYTVLPPGQRGRRTGHAAIEIVALVFDDEAAQANLREALTIRRVAIEDNIIEQVAAAGIRVGHGWKTPRDRVGRRADGTRVQRGSNGASVGQIVLRGNRMRAVRGPALEVGNVGDPMLALHCSGNTADGRAVQHPACAAPATAISGATQSCAAAPRPPAGAVAGHPVRSAPARP